MAHSYKKYAAGGIVGCKSEKFDKRLWHKRLRRLEREQLDIANDIDYQIMPIVHDVSDPWVMIKDGKNIYFTVRGLRKEINEHISGLLHELKKLHTSFMIEQFCRYFEINISDKKMCNITNEEKEEFIMYFMKKNTRK
jgi:hypothetical protein